MNFVLADIIVVTDYRLAFVEESMVVHFGSLIEYYLFFGKLNYLDLCGKL